jgi:hypothetical protein
MTLHFSKTPGGIQLRGENDVPYHFTYADSTVFENEDGSVNEGSFILLALNDSAEFWKGVEVIFFEQFVGFNDFKDRYPKIDHDLYIFYGTQTERDLLLYLFRDIKEYLNHS